ncbi:MAG: hypothetical protein QW303_02590 [Nitrososphaerota archaeon]
MECYIVDKWCGVASINVDDLEKEVEMDYYARDLRYGDCVIVTFDKEHAIKAATAIEKLGRGGCGIQYYPSVVLFLVKDFSSSKRTRERIVYVIGYCPQTTTAKDWAVKRLVHVFTSDVAIYHLEYLFREPDEELKKGVINNYVKSQGFLYLKPGNIYKQI